MAPATGIGLPQNNPLINPATSITAINQAITISANSIPEVDLETLHPNDISIKDKMTEWKPTDLLKKNNIRAANGIVTSAFYVHLQPFAKTIERLKGRMFDIGKKNWEYNGHHKENAILKTVQTRYEELQNLLQTICTRTSGPQKRFVALIVFSIIISIAAYGISSVAASSSRLITREDLQTANTTAEERFLLTKLELKRLEKDSKRIDSLERRIDKMEFNDGVDEYGRKLKMEAEYEKRELELILKPETYRFEESSFMKKIAQDIRTYFAKINNDLFDHVSGTGITEVLYFTTFTTIALRDGHSIACEDGYVMVVATTIIPNTDIVGTATEDPQRYTTQDGRYLYIGQDYITDGSTFRPSNSLSSQRLILSSREISVSVLNNTVFMIENNGLHLDINITCPGNFTQETLYNNPFLKLHTSCKVSSLHLNISTFTQQYQIDIDVDVDLDLFENIDEDLDYIIGYHRTPIDNKHDIIEMHSKAEDIFVKETQILQHQMEKLEGEFSTIFIKWLDDAGTVVTGWINGSMHNVVAGFVAFVICIGMILFLVVIYKCCSLYNKKKVN